MSEKQSHILVVDDNPDNLRLVAGVLKGRGYTVRPARDGRTALNSAISNPPNLILLDILMPGMDGYETCRRIKANEKTRDVPIIFISALDDAFDKVKAFTAGCVDYVSKPFNAEELLARIETHLSLRDARKELAGKNARLQREIEERKRAENNAKESEKRFAAVMNSMEAIMYVADMETYELLFINQYTRDLFGDIDGEICWRTLQTDQDGPCEFCTNRHLVKNGEPTGVYTWDFQNTVTGRWCHIQDQAILWPDGRLVRMEIASDISDLKRKEKTLRKQNQYMEALHKTSIDLISRLDLDDLLQNILARAVSLANVTDGFIHLYDPGENVLEIRYGVGAFARHIGFRLKPGEGLGGKVWQTGESLLIEDYRAWPGRSKNASFDAVRSIMGIPLKTGEIVEGVIGLSHTGEQGKIVEEEVDIMEHFAKLASIALDNARLYEKMKTAREIAEKANKAKSEFLSNMSHEIRTPLNPILGFSEILIERADSFQKGYLRHIHSSGRALLRIIDDILDLSKIEAGKLDIQLEPAGIRELVDDIEAIFSYKFEDKGVELIMDVDPDLPDFLVIDEVRIRQILINLIGNAIKFTTSGHVKVLVRCVNKDDDSRKTDLFFEVEDTGIGIPEDQQEAVFESFKQQKGQKMKTFGGTGLGLTITKKLTELMNGKIILVSEAGEGCIFRVYFYDIDFPALSDAPLDPLDPAPTIDFEPATILLVDDSLSNRELIKEYLKETSLRVIEAESGEHALYFLKIDNKPDLILMDLRMPGRDGCEVTEIIKKERALKHIPVIAYTASAMKEDERKIGALFDGFIEKPASKGKLLEELGRFLSAAGGVDG